VFPMLAVGDALRAQEPGASVFYVGTARGMEAKLLPARGDDLELLDVAPLVGGGLRGFVRGAWRAATSLLPARALLRRRRPDAVLSVGGYAAGPVSIAAWSAGIPVAILEPNGVFGLANRLLAPFAARAYTGFGSPGQGMNRDKVRNLGVPLRSTFTRSPYRALAGRFHVLILGGSQGAAGLNQAAPEMMQIVQRAIPYATICHQTGRGKARDVERAYAALSLQPAPRVLEFVDDVARELAAADVVIQRAGASSLAELCVIGRPSILVPFPFAAGQHQLANARSVEAQGGARVVEQRDATSARLARELIDLARSPEAREGMARQSGHLGRPNAASDIATDLRALARSHQGRGR